ncbi:MAG: hypothetical protein ETSY1_19865 [Candidatus Entotheonella factor]|uniref:TIGR02646 family protein n=1 Tax=Entotheonella factor TaxID=1429438 RepID=W4LJA3_ENTF1|nr:MAG: hypothetical protein ETSY1_19865 [Candidatus Entotheonella factor]
MIRYNSENLLTMPGFAEWNQKAEAERDALLTAVRAGNEPDFKGKERIWQELKNNWLREFCHGKCMYCEGNTQAGAHDDAEHYRPKNAVYEDPTHPGYYWLVFAWQNILLSCIKCNRPPGKSTQFPIAGAVRVSHPSHDSNMWWEELKTEEPLLLHPYFDEPSEHFSVRKHGFLRGRTDQGRATIEICKLNRPQLCAEREREEGQIVSRLIERYYENTITDTIISGPLFSASDRFSFYLNSIVQIRLQFGTL